MPFQAYYSDMSESFGPRKVDSLGATAYAPRVAFPAADRSQVGDLEAYDSAKSAVRHTEKARRSILPTNRADCEVSEGMSMSYGGFLLVLARRIQSRLSKLVGRFQQHCGLNISSDASLLGRGRMHT